MKALRNMVIGTVVLTAVVFIAGAVFANEGYCGMKGMKGMKEKCEARMNLLKSSAAALQTSNPDLAQQLNDWVAEDTKKMEDMKAHHEAKAKLLTDAATALEASNPDLAKQLKDMAEKKPAEKMAETGEEKK